MQNLRRSGTLTPFLQGRVCLCAAFIKRKKNNNTARLHEKRAKNEGVKSD